MHMRYNFFFRLCQYAALSFVVLLPLSVAFATSHGLKNPIKYSGIEAFLLDIVHVVVQYGVILVVFFLVYVGFKFVTAQGNPEKISEAKKMFVWVVVGAFVLLGVFVIREAICGTLNQLKPDEAPEVCQRTAPLTGSGQQ